MSVLSSKTKVKSKLHSCQSFRLGGVIAYMISQYQYPISDLIARHHLLIFASIFQPSRSLVPSFPRLPYAFWAYSH